VGWTFATAHFVSLFEPVVHIIIQDLIIKKLSCSCQESGGKFEKIEPLQRILLPGYFFASPASIEGWTSFHNGNLAS
jgi:hypothetical protein